MRYLILSIVILALSFSATAQTVTQKLQKGFSVFEKDTQLTHAISSLYVIDAQTGQVVFDKNSKIGLAPASTQKIITSVTAFELLGKDYRYKTSFGIGKKNTEAFYIIPSGDPTLGSPRWNSTKDDGLIKRIVNAIPKTSTDFSSINLDNQNWGADNIPDGWIWQDIANYYGASAVKLNFLENQFDVVLKSGNKIGDPVEIVKTIPDLHYYELKSQLTSAGKGTGDNAYIYFPLVGEFGIINGTIPINENGFKISGAFPHSEDQFIKTLKNEMSLKGINTGLAFESSKFSEMPKIEPNEYKIIYTETSPSLDSIIYWFNKKSINLYGEALIKTFAYEKQGFGSTDSGVSIVKKFWKEKKLDENELNIVDGSGLSPLNRVTTHAQVEILKYAKTKDWFPYFYTSLPEYNGMKIKSGTIRNVKGFCGYHTAKNGKEYIFSFLVNNYNGSASGLVNKMYKVLDLLK